MKKIKQLKKLIMLAVIPTTILFNASFAFADTTINKLQLMFDQIKTNPEFQNGQLYINAKFVTQSGLVLEWNSETNSFVFGGGGTVSDPVVVTPPATTPTLIVDEQTTDINLLKNTVEYNGNTYYKIRDLIIKYDMSMNDIKFNSGQNTIVFTKTNKSLNLNDKSNIILKNGIIYIKESTFINCK